MTRHYNMRSDAFGPLLSVCLLLVVWYPLQLEWLVWIAWIPMLLWLGRTTLTSRQIALRAWLAGFLYHLGLFAPFLSIGWWGWGQTTPVDGSQMMLLRQRLFVALLVAIASIVRGGVFALAIHSARPWLHRPLAAVWIVPALWVIGERLGSWMFAEFHWGIIGNQFASQPVFLQLASLTGVYGLSFLVVHVNTALALALRHVGAEAESLSRSERSASPVRVLAALVVATGMTIAAAAYGLQRLAGESNTARGWMVALLQGGRASYHAGELASDGFDPVYESLLRRARAYGAQLIVLPETVWLRTFQVDGTRAHWMQAGMGRETVQRRLAQDAGRFEVVAMGVDAIEAGRMYNALTWWSRNEWVGWYRKRRLVPFAEEHIPLLSRVAPTNQLHGPGFRYTRGQGTQLMRVDGVSFGAFICQEVLDPALIRRTVLEGAQLLVTTGNDGAFTSPLVAREQANVAILRAVETGRTVARAMKTGISALIGPTGRVQAMAPMNTPALVLGMAQVRSEATAYVRWGDWVAWASALLALIAIASNISYNNFRKGRAPSRRSIRIVSTL
jgi:apolipoprotein N-acyltransferase